MMSIDADPDLGTDFVYRGNLLHIIRRVRTLFYHSRMRQKGVGRYRMRKEARLSHLHALKRSALIRIRILQSYTCTLGGHTDSKDRVLNDFERKVLRYSRKCVFCIT